MLDEHDVIRLIAKSFGRLPEGYLPIGDDVALLPRATRGKKVVLKCDMLVAKTDVPPGMSLKMAARKAVAMCVSDFAAKGVRPTAFMISLGLRRETPEDEVVELASGLLEASREVKAILVKPALAGRKSCDQTDFGWGIQLGQPLASSSSALV